MLEEIHHHLIRYLVLILILGFGLVFFFLSSHEPALQTRIVGIVLGAYLFWGIIHHYLDKDLTALIVLEYLLVATVAFIIISNLLRFT